MDEREAWELRRRLMLRMGHALAQLQASFTSLSDSASMITPKLSTGGDGMAKVLTRSELIYQAFHTSGGLRDTALTKLRRHRDLALAKIGLNEIPDLSEYIKAVHFRNWVFQAEPAKPDLSCEDSLAEAHLKANIRIYALCDHNLAATAHEDLCNRMEVAAIHDFLNRTRALLK